MKLNGYDVNLHLIDESIRMLKDVREIVAVRNDPFLLAHRAEIIETTAKVKSYMDEVEDFTGIGESTIPTT